MLFLSFLLLKDSFVCQIYITGGAKIDALDNNNNYVEALDTRTGLVANVSSQLLPAANGGLAHTCVIALPEDNSFVVTGGEILKYPT